MEALSEAQGVRELISRCLAGDGNASRRFQQRYGELIYGYPIRVYRLPPEDAGDFYVFAFEDNRIYRRVRTFEGRAPFRAYLLGFVLDDLVLEWKRGDRQLDSVALEDVDELPDPNPATDGTRDGTRDAMDADVLSRILAEIEPSKAVILKLLHVEDCELSAAEVHYLADVSGRSVPEVLRGVDGLRSKVRERETALKSLEDALDGVQAWLHLYERRCQRIADDLAALPPTSSTAVRLQQERAELQRKIERRRQQQAKLLIRAKRRKVTAPYKEIAELLNTSVGNIGSQITRLRQELQGRGLSTSD